MIDQLIDVFTTIFPILGGAVLAAVAVFGIPVYIICKINSKNESE